MRILLLIVIGITGGVIGGMGMGGGTLLIPLLTLAAGIELHAAQSINLIAFIPMSVVALIIHVKNKLVDGKYLLWVALPAVAASVPASLLIRRLGGKILSRFFGGFLILLGGYQFASIIVSKVREYRAAHKNEKNRLYKNVYK